MSRETYVHKDYTHHPNVPRFCSLINMTSKSKNVKLSSATGWQTVRRVKCCVGGVGGPGAGGGGEVEGGSVYCQSSYKDGYVLPLIQKIDCFRTRCTCRLLLSCIIYEPRWPWFFGKCSIKSRNVFIDVKTVYQEIFTSVCTGKYSCSKHDDSLEV